MNLGNCVVDTKVYPGQHGNFSEDGIRESMNRSLAALGKYKIRTLYLHSPDPTVPIKTTLQVINDLYNEGHFEQFGLSNYSSWQVTEIVGIADHHGWVKPTVYEGKYNAIERTVEDELLPCLRHFGIKFYAYSPLAGGVLAGNILSEEDMAAREGGRWDPQACRFALAIRSQYAPILPAVRELKEALDRHGLGLAEASYRWLQHHSVLHQDDAVIIAATSVKHMEMNMKNCEGGPLSEGIVELFERAWLRVKANAAHYAS
ncbi:NADP-dependent oxidoreductase domain-containing protein [Boletus edulis BED1]|uniref:NADP-dependent oxidoreductase domain-containing protein n=1 Tax=Boletus edulis BED1 TaxID=1328754 RepID=A0AAD4GAR6_BOLED|nr:NADP-dependent oxidoreductase domain-containing protein [Boletus edulis BED1]